MTKNSFSANCFFKILSQLLKRGSCKTIKISAGAADCTYIAPLHVFCVGCAILWVSLSNGYYWPLFNLGLRDCAAALQILCCAVFARVLQILCSVVFADFAIAPLRRKFFAARFLRDNSCFYSFNIITLFMLINQKQSIIIIHTY